MKMKMMVKEQFLRIFLSTGKFRKHFLVIWKRIFCSEEKGHFFERARFVCGSMSNVDHQRTRAAVSEVAAAKQQPEGWRFVPDAILPGYQWAPQWVPARTPTVHWGTISGKAVGGPNTVQHSSTVQKHGKHGSGALATRALATRVCCVLTGPETKNPLS